MLHANACLSPIDIASNLYKLAHLSDQERNEHVLLMRARAVSSTWLWQRQFCKSLLPRQPNLQANDLTIINIRIATRGRNVNQSGKFHSFGHACTPLQPSLCQHNDIRHKTYCAITSARPWCVACRRELVFCKGGHVLKALLNSATASLRNHCLNCVGNESAMMDASIFRACIT